MSYFVYILRTSGNTLYVGQTKDLEKRLEQHKARNGKTAKYLMYFESFALVYSAEFEYRGEAMRREVELKKLTRDQKGALISGDMNLLKKL